VVNSAGAFAEVAIAEATQEHWNETIEINLSESAYNQSAPGNTQSLFDAAAAVG
jgi:hypothetical protein